MMKLGVLLAMAGLAAAAQPEFDVASVKPSSGELGKDRASFLRYNDAGIDSAYYSLNIILGEAFEFPRARITSPDSRVRDLLNRSYDIAARTNHAVPKEQLRLMLQTLLADRFKLVMHAESKVQPIYRLVLGKNGPNLQTSADEGIEPRLTHHPRGIEFHNATVWRFAAMLSQYMGRPVLDQTQIQGLYDFNLKIDDLPAPDKHVASDGSWSSPSIFTEIQKQLGLRLDPDKAPVDYLVIDHLKKPSEN